MDPIKDMLCEVTTDPIDGVTAMWQYNKHHVHNGVNYSGPQLYDDLFINKQHELCISLSTYNWIKKKVVFDSVVTNWVNMHEDTYTGITSLVDHGYIIEKVVECYTTNVTSLLSQDLHLIEFNVLVNCRWFPYVVIRSHNGVDTRCGYSKPVAFINATNYSLASKIATAVVYGYSDCKYCNYGFGTKNGEDFVLVRNERKKVDIMDYVAGSSTVYCKHCGKQLYVRGCV